MLTQFILSKVLTLERGHLFISFDVLGFKGTILKFVLNAFLYYYYLCGQEIHNMIGKILIGKNSHDETWSQ
jgi:hypothetical protein